MPFSWILLAAAAVAAALVAVALKIALGIARWHWGRVIYRYSYWYQQQLEKHAARALELEARGVESSIVITAFGPFLFEGRASRTRLVPVEMMSISGKEFRLYQLSTSEPFGVRD